MIVLRCIFLSCLMLFTPTDVRAKKDKLVLETEVLNEKVSHEKKLTRYLLKRYHRIGKEGRPITNTSSAMVVWFGLNMMQMDLNEKDNKLTTSVWCRLRWTDEYLTWDPARFGGLKMVRMSSGKIWIPDVMLYNTADTDVMEREALITVFHNGSMLWIPHRIYKSECKVDVTNFPFDLQHCNMTFGSWAYFGNEIDLRFHSDFEHMDLSDLQRESTEWEVLATHEKRLEVTYECCPDPWVTLTFSLSLKRKIVFSTVILTLPCIFLAFMTLVVFWLPPERPDRIGIAMGLFSSFLLLLLILLEAAPPTASSVPTIGIYYCFNLVLIMLSVLLSSVVINVSRKWEEMLPGPHWARWLSSSFLGRLLCLYDLRRVKLSKDQVRSSSTEREAKNGYLNVSKHNTLEMNKTDGTHAHLVGNHREHVGNQDMRHCNNVGQCQGHRRRMESCNNSLGDCSDSPHHPQYFSTVGEWHPMHDVQTEHTVRANTHALSMLTDAMENTIRETTLTSTSDLSVLIESFQSIEKITTRIQKNTNELVRALKYTQVRSKMQARKLEWQVAAAALDRLFFFIFVFAILISMIVFFPRPSLVANL